MAALNETADPLVSFSYWRAGPAGCTSPGIAMILPWKRSACGQAGLNHCLPAHLGHVAPEAEVSLGLPHLAATSASSSARGPAPLLGRPAAQQALPPLACRCSTRSWAWAPQLASAPARCCCMPALPRARTRCGSSFASAWPGAAAVCWVGAASLSAAAAGAAIRCLGARTCSLWLTCRAPARICCQSASFQAAALCMKGQNAAAAHAVFRQLLGGQHPRVG